MALSPERKEAFERDGFFIVRRFAPPATLDAMLARVIELARAHARGESIRPAYVVEEEALREDAKAPEDHLSKLFRVHRHEPVFAAFAREPALLDLVGGILGPDLDCFLSQFIFKNPGALGQPWHQDAFYFPFDRGPQVGTWLAVSEARLENGPLWVLPGSHREPVHAVVRDRRPHAHFAYVEIADHDMSGAVPVLMEPGDLLFFHSHLMHMSTDNASDRRRAAMVYHYGETGTDDRSLERFGFVPPNVDWLSLRGRGLAHPEPDLRSATG
jgi:ectoine hydroxylase-related dioxygenase (phytanoyl-CoA dioxygenase family)